MSAPLRVFASGEQRPLDLEGIEADLASLWREASAAGSAPAMRACRANVVVLLSGRDRAASGEDRLDAMLPIVARGYPSRIVVIRAGAEGDPGTMTASVSALCTLGAGARYVCCESIRLDAAAGAEPSLPGTVLALTIGELPIIVWVLSEPPFSEPWFATLLGFAERLMVDTFRCRIPADTMKALDGIVRAPRAIAIADFEWLRCAPWRRVIADAFESPEPRGAALAGFDAITFVETSAAPTQERHTLRKQGILADEDPIEPEASAASLLLRAWMKPRVAARSFLWSPPEADDRSRSRSRTEEDPSRGIVAIRFEGTKDRPSFHLEIPAPREAPAPSLPDFASLLAGQEDHPLNAAGRAAPAAR